MSNEELTSIVRIYERYMMDFIGRTVKNLQDKEDILQEVWMNVAIYGPEAIEKEKLCGFLRKTAKWAIVNYYRKNEYESRSRDFADWIPGCSCAPNVPHPHEAEYCRALMDVCTSKMKPHVKAYILDYYDRGISVEVIAGNAGVTYETVRKTVRDFSVRLRRAYGRIV